MVRTSSGLMMQSGRVSEETARGVVAGITSDGGLMLAAICAARSGQQARTSAQTVTRLPPWSLLRGLRIMPADLIISDLLISYVWGIRSACFLPYDMRSQNLTMLKRKGRG